MIIFLGFFTRDHGGDKTLILIAIQFKYFNHNLY